MGQLFSDCAVQMPILFPHGGLLVPGKVVKAHGNFDQHAVQGQKDVHHLTGIAPSIVWLAYSILLPLRHGVHRLVVLRHSEELLHNK